MNLGVAEKEAGNEAFKVGDFETAVEHYTAAIAQNPNAEAYYSNRSAAYHRMGKYQSALVDADKCVALNSEWPKGHFRRGEALASLSLYARASESYTTALDLDPQDVAIRQALAKAQKAVYEKAKSMAGDDSDDELPLAPPSHVQPDSSTSSFASSKRSEIINHRLALGTGITSMDDYMRFKQAGGSTAPKDPTNPLANYTLQKNENFKPTKSRADFLAEMGIDTSPGASSYLSGTPNSNYEDSYSKPRVGEDSGILGSSTGTSSANAEALAAKRAEFLASIGMKPEGEGAPAAGRSGSSNSSTAGALGGGSEWSKIRGNTNYTSTTPTLVENSSEGGVDGSASDTGRGGMTKAEFMAQLGLDPSEAAESNVPRGSALNLARSRSITPPHERGRPYAPQAPIPTGAVGGMTREEFIANMGLDSQAPSDEPIGRKYSAEQQRTPLTSGRLPPTEGDSVDVYMRERDSLAGSSPGTSSYGGGLTSSSVGNSPSLNVLGVGSSSAPGGGSNEGASTYASRVAEVAAQQQGQVVAGVQLKSAADYLASMGVGAKPQEQYNYAASGYTPGTGDTINNSWMSDFRKKKVEGAVNVVGDTRAPELKQNFSDFHFRKFKEGAEHIDANTKETILGDAILAESLRGYEYDKFSK